MTWILSLGLLVLFTSPAYASLGGRVESLSFDQKALAAKRMNADVFKKYSVHKLDSDANRIKEYVNSDGLVFAVSWVGLDHPDLSVLLGSYFKAFNAESKMHRIKRGIRNQKITASDLVVQKWGHMRKLEGHAYDQSLIPEGVSLNEIW